MERTRSLKLAEMPFLCKKLGFGNPLEDGRVTGKVDLGYNNKVLVGHWLEKRVEEPVYSGMDLQTTYNEDYQGKPGVLDTQSIWDNLVQGQGSIELNEGREGEYPNNMATVYDLAYRCRVRDFITGNYDNKINYGRKECMKSYWASQLYDRRRHYCTEYADSYNIC